MVELDHWAITMYCEECDDGTILYNPDEGCFECVQCGHQTP
eukprot:g2413.t1